MNLNASPHLNQAKMFYYTFQKEINCRTQCFNELNDKQIFVHSKQQKNPGQENFNQLMSDSILTQKWSLQEIQNLIELYVEYGPSWTYFTTKIPNKSHKQIKRKLNKQFERVSNILSNQEKTKNKKYELEITTDKLRTMVDFVNRIQKSIRYLNLTPDYTNRLFYFRDQILKLFFLRAPVEGQTHQLNQLISLVKNLKYQLRRQRKNRRLKIEEILRINHFDRVIKQNVADIAMNTNIFDYWQRENVHQLELNVENSLQLKQGELNLPQLDDFSDLKLNQPVDLQKQCGTILGRPQHLF